MIIGSGAAVGSGASVKATNMARRDVNIGADAIEVANAFLRIHVKSVASPVY